MFDISEELPCSLATVIREQWIPPARNGKRLHVSTLVRWIKDGVRAPDGRRVFLEALRLGGRWVTSREAVQRFAEALTPSRPLSDRKNEGLRTSTAREKAATRATEELRKHRI